jgi:ubiquinone/menaquinone biosynthesis C-methylase UbiE
VEVTVRPEKSADYFQFLSRLGLTKHYGSLDATRELARLTGIQPGQLVLDLGCGVGATPVFLAEEYQTLTIGADLIEGMLPQGLRRAEDHQVEDITGFLAADARLNPFPNDCFDVVLLESVNVFFEDKVSAFREYARVIKPGGWLGITEMTWLQPPKDEYREMFKKAAFVTAHQAREWIDLLEQAGYVQVAGEAYAIDPRRETKGRFQRYGFKEVLKTIPRIFKLLLTDKHSRSFFKDGTSNLSTDIMEYVGYGVFVGQKP